MAAAVDWSNLTVAGAFMFGALVGALAVLRVVRAVSAELEPRRRRRRPGGEPED